MAHLSSVGRLIVAVFDVLPTFGRPNFMLPADQQALLGILAR